MSSQDQNIAPAEPGDAAGAAPSSSAATPARPSGGNGLRKRALITLTSALVLVGAGWLVYDWLVLSHFEDTDNAYVQGNVVQITPQVAGTVTAILADETEPVQAGQPLVRLDAADARVELAQAEAALGETVRQVRTRYANNGALAAQVRQRQADVAKSRTELLTAQQNLARRQRLGNAISGEELAHARDAAASAQSAVSASEAALATAREQLVSNQALTEGTAVEQHPSVQAAAAKVREAWLTVHRMALPAPVSGFVAKRTVQLGQRVSPGTPLMTEVPLNQLWVDANFKENQLRQIRIGQPVTLTADVYGSKVVYDGQVVGLGMSTGAASALLPAQNATGNWIKVVQRVPVRISLDPAQLKEHPLRVGLSMLAKVDIADQSGPAVASGTRDKPVGQTAVFEGADDGAEAVIRRIVARNLGLALPPEPPKRSASEPGEASPAALRGAVHASASRPA